MPLRQCCVQVVLLLTASLGLSERALAQAVDLRVSISGIVKGDGATVAAVRVSLDEAQVSVVSDSDGRFTLKAVPSGHYHLTARKAGFAGKTVAVAIGTRDTSLTIELIANVTTLEPLSVTASRAPIAATSSTQSISTLEGSALHQSGGISLAHAIQSLPGLRAVTTGAQIGKPMIRGLSGARTLVLANGFRLEDYSWSDEDGPSIDVRLGQRVEVVRGPASVLYGSDALAGVVNVVAAPLPFADGTSHHRDDIELYGASNGVETGGVLQREGTRGAWGYRATGTGHFAMNYRTPLREQPNSGYWAFNGDIAAGRTLAGGFATLRASHYGGEFHLLEASGPEVDDPDGGPVRQVMDDRLQFTHDRMFSTVRLETRAQLQRHALAEVSDDCQPAPGQTTCTKVKDQQAFGLTLTTGLLDVLVHKAFSSVGTLTVGASGSAQSSDASGPIFLVPSASGTNGAVYLLGRRTTGVVELSAGVRQDMRSMSNDPNTALSLTSHDRSWNATTGSIGAVVHAGTYVDLVANAARGWRAPNLFDLYANGLNRGDARYEIGNSDLKAEVANTFDGGVRLHAARLDASATVYRSLVDGFIFVTPTTETRGGLQVFRHVQRDARLTGGELEARVQATPSLSLRGAYDVTRGTDRPNDANLPLMPPPRSQVGVDWRQASGHELSAGADITHHDAATRIATVDTPTDAYTLLNVRGGSAMTWAGRRVHFDLVVHNALNTKYRDFLSRYKSFADQAGANVMVRASTFLF